MLLPLVIATVSVAAALLGLGMFRVAALSENRYTVELADWAATRSVVEQGVGLVEPSGEQLTFDVRGEAFGATG